MSAFLSVLLVILVVAVVILVVLYFLGKKLERRQVEQRAVLEVTVQTVSTLIIDKKKTKVKEANLPKMIYEQIPKHMRWAKTPVVKTKVEPKVMTLVASEKVFAALSVETETRVIVDGLYITEIKSIRGDTVSAAPKKGGFSTRFKEDKSKSDKAEADKR